jgi:hypothetical protein
MVWHIYNLIKGKLSQNLEQVIQLWLKFAMLSLNLSVIKVLVREKPLGI